MASRRHTVEKGANAQSLAHHRRWLWVATAVIVLLLLLPYYINYINFFIAP